MKSLNIHIDDSGLCEVRIEKETGEVTKKLVSYTTMLDMLIGSTETNMERLGDCDISEIFPGDGIVSVIQTKHYLENDVKWYILLREPHPVDFDFFETVYKKVGVPKTIFAIKVVGNRVTKFKTVAVKDMFVTSKTKIYAYPFSNVSPSGDVCTGANFEAINQELDEESIYSLISIPEMFFAMPNSEHSYGHNKSGLYYRDMLKELEDKPFIGDWLEETSMTYNDFMKRLN